jgi:hypothetical protein
MARKLKALTASAVLLVLLVVVSGAHAAGPVKGGSYTGSLVPSRDGGNSPYATKA